MSLRPRIARRLPSLRVSAETYDRVIDINVKGVWLSMRHEIPAMLKSGGGAIVNTSSVAGVVAFPGIEVYAASKHAVIGLTKSAAVEFGKKGIRVNAVLPVAVDVFDIEPLPADQPFRVLVSALSSPHIGYVAPGRPF